MCDKMAISAYILKIVEKDPFLRRQMKAKEMFNCRNFFPQISNTLKLNWSKMRQICGVFFVNKEILVKLWFKGLNYHNFHVFDHCKFSYYSIFSHASVVIWYFNIRTIFVFKEIFQLFQNEVSDLSMLFSSCFILLFQVLKHRLLLLHIILYSFNLWINFSFSCLSNGLEDVPLKELLISSLSFSHLYDQTKSLFTFFLSVVSWLIFLGISYRFGIGCHTMKMTLCQCCWIQDFL